MPRSGAMELRELRYFLALAREGNFTRVERQYRVVHWTDLPRGGHFLEWEVPDLVAADLWTFLRRVT